jgi:tetratricopeptide (TPR) repeat protein
VRAAQQQDAAARATVALVRARQAIRVGAHDEARLLLSAAAQHAAETGAYGLQIDALRLDAIVARREADPRAAVESLKLAGEVAVGASLAVQAALIDSELVLALADNASWIEAFEVQNREPSAAIAVLPPVAAARLESFAVLSRRSQAYEAARAALMEAAAIRRARQDGSGEAANTAQLAELALISGQLEEASQLAERATELGRASGRFDVVVSAGITLLHARVRVGDASPDSRAHAAQLSIEAQSVGGVAQQVISLDLHAALLSLSGDIEQAQVVCRQAQSLAESQPLVRLRARTQARSAALLHLRGQHLDAAHAAQSAAELARDAEDRTSHAAAMTVAGAALRALGRHDESLLALGHASTEAAMAGRRDLAAQAGFALGDGYRALGHHRQARHCFAIGLQHAEAIADRHLIGDITRGIAACVAAEGNPQAALQTLNRLRAFDDPVLSAVSSTDAARVQLQLGAPKEALVLLSRLDAGVLNDAQRGDMLTVLGHALVASGRVDEAAETLAAAVEAHRGADDHGLGAALFLYGQVQGMRGRGQECGEALGEALVITARLGLPEQHMIRQAIERIHQQAETV